MSIFSFFSRKSSGLVDQSPGGSEKQWKAEAQRLKSRVEELEAELKKVRVDPSPAATGGAGSDKQRVSATRGGRRSSQAKLESLEQTGDEQTQMYIKSQFLAAETIEESTTPRTALEKMRVGATAVVASNRFRQPSAQWDADLLAQIAKAPSPAPAAVNGAGPSGTLSPYGAHPCAAIVPPRHLGSSLSGKQLDSCLRIQEQIDAASWDADILGMCATLHSPMTYIVTHCLRKWNTAALLQVDEASLTLLLETIEHGYLATNPYHNAIHAADVAYTTHVMLTHGVKDALNLSELQCAVAVLAAAAHDFRHPGVGANYLVAMSDELALTYNDKSPLESMHTAEFFKLLQKNPSFDVFAKLERKEQQDVRKCIIQMILATDMSVHFDYLDKFNKRFPARDANTVEPAPEVSNEDQNFAMAMLLHCSDISNPAKPVAAYTEWTDRVIEEFYYQTDLERSNDLTITNPFAQRNSPGIAKMQTGFIAYIVRPIFTSWCDFIPQLKEMCMPHIERNAAMWKGDTPYIPAEQVYIDPKKKSWDWKNGGGWR